MARVKKTNRYTEKIDKTETLKQNEKESEMGQNVFGWLDRP